MSFAFTFPGQGSQTVGMGRTLFAAYRPAREIFQRVDDALGEKLSAIIFEGPEETLRLTANAQPALMAVSLAALGAMAVEGLSIDRAALVAGHSLGEYTALAATGAMTVETAAKLLRRRGEAMQAAVAPGEGAMAALLGLDLATAEAVAAEAAGDEICEVANDNAPGQVVVSGSRAAVERAVAIARSRGARRPMLLPVSAPFHCSLMQPAADVMADALAGAGLETPSAPLLANVSASLLHDPAAIRDSLVAQITGRVRWRESVASLSARGVRTVLEIGSGRVLTGLAKRIDPALEAIAVGTSDDIATFAQRMAA